MNVVQEEAARLLDTRPLATIEGAAGLAAPWDADALAAGAVAAFADAVAALVGEDEAVVDGPLVGGWFSSALRPAGWAVGSMWSPISGDYRTADGWIRLHTNAPHHRAAALGVLGVPEDRDAVAQAVAGWSADDLETAVVDAGGAAAVMRSAEAWTAHPQGAAVRAEPLIEREHTVPAASGWTPDPSRPLAGLKVLDLTRVIAGPVAARALAALGAEVLRVDSPDWDEPALVPDMTLGKRAARVDAATPEGRERLRALLAQADVLVHGYRRGAMEHLGLGEEERQRLRPGLVEASLTAYGWTGPWSGRRGFDSLVQMSAGVAERGMAVAGAAQPVPLPVQALDHATGWLIAAAVVAGLRDRVRGGSGSSARLSLARTAAELLPAEPREAASAELPSTRIATPWGAADLLDPPFRVAGVRAGFEAGPEPLGTDAPFFADQAG